MEAGLTLEEVYNAWKEMKDSAPGPDEKPYSVYHKLWNHKGQLIIYSGSFSVDQSKLLENSH